MVVNRKFGQQLQSAVAGVSNQTRISFRVISALNLLVVACLTEIKDYISSFFYSIF